ncbi:2-oxo acid dehydrogenase subunit E2 [Akkermansiaceae bacterium]|nr:2-oxo acid dehydrogenase subunit E2 [Akkermansiaceae bacterium]MDA7863975.1 2-oxo acid dehydrogenase subunit E2 [Akkermansiaceae bacterium]MDA7876613.1 2-oxo acid dehydrogenase subunit E2 [Akkermansiaceae bacterium]MDB4457817.1 2-oxo acid dehydrogenase subunit E2 [Akkermansiaceae bacterium]MDB4462942.1 2-oxo acid dehydrogenase subunit E2 [Akkermansiaceae bacterium]
MPQVPIIMPQLGESIAEARIVRLLIAEGDTVVVDQEIIEVETNKATMAVTTLCGGTITKVRGEEGVDYAVGSLLGILEATEEEIERTGSPILGEEEEAPTQSNAPEQEENLHFKSNESSYEEPKLVEPSVRGLPVPAGVKGAHYISPRMRARMDELGLQTADISAIAGTGAGGRVTIEDLEKFLDYIQEWPRSNASPMRLAVADAMRRSWTRPFATVGLPIPMDKLLEFRSRQNPKPGLTLYVLRAFAIALSEEPTTAGFLIGDKVVHPRAFDLGVAVQVEDGVMVPVLRNVDQNRVAELAQEYDELVKAGRDRRLTAEQTSGGIATVTNFGTFGLKWGTPIPLPNETLILGLAAGIKVPRWSDEVGAFVPVTETELCLTFDHRVVDGGGAGLLLQRVGQLLQEPEKL